MNNDLIDYLLKSLLDLPPSDRTPQNVKNVLNLAAEAAGADCAQLLTATSIKTINPECTLIRMEEVSKIVGLARSTLYKFMSDPENDFPRPVKLSAATGKGAAVAWVLSEVHQWVRSRLASRCEYESRQGARP
ncbi:AlpA family transcriptional regulator [Pseudomonas sp. SG20052]|uniref:helix-turn-helix transcriptional regulator n=1 Tax=Pseudomonas sp. SG20052 TaxID=3074147 RepID=UPI00287F8022|nr:AlpA family transcriptional regulator [Pseudomonas sp. SG20052]WNF53013.1 AlpA family transcriptional regulator [Pseudomonas sp. SG20052]